MRNLFVILLCLIGIGGRAMTYYVTPEGYRPNDPSYPIAVSGQSVYSNIQDAADLSAPGDIIYIMNGTYSPVYNQAPVLSISKPGTSTAWIKYQNYPGHNPVIYAGGISYATWNIIKLSAKKINNVIYVPAYIEISGITIKGNRGEITSTPTCAVVQNSGLYNGAGILITGPFAYDWYDRPYGIPGQPNSNTPTTIGDPYGIPHHISIKNCKVFDCTSSGISAQRSDYITIENNEVYNNCWYTKDGTSGINIYEPVKYDKTITYSANEYQIIIKNNKVYGNKLLIAQQCENGQNNFLDGNGIIVDDFKCTQNHDYNSTHQESSCLNACATQTCKDNCPKGAISNENYNSPFIGTIYSGKTLILNNVIYNNGGSGLHIYQSNNIYTYNNTMYGNMTVNPGNGDILADQSTNLEFKNNLIQTTAGSSRNSFYIGTYNGANPTISSSNNFIKGGVAPGSINYTTQSDFYFLSPGTTGCASFIINSNSPAKDAGISLSALTNDFAYSLRPIGSGIDIGAYEYVPEAFVQNTSNVTFVTNSISNIHAGKNVTSTTQGNVTISSGQRVVFKAGINTNNNNNVYIRLADGFSALSGSEFHAFIPTCTVSSNTIQNFRKSEIDDHELFEDIKNIEVTPYPNPISLGNLYFGKIVNNYSFINHTGSAVLQGSNEDRINVTGFPKGMYMLKLDDKTEKIIIQ